MSTAAAVTSLAELLEQAAAKSPDAVAIVDPQGQTLTYGQLNEAASRMADVLWQRGVKPGDRVGICMPKSINSVICLMGAMKARAAYVPVDYSAPPERNAFIFNDCGTSAICADEPRTASLVETGTEASSILTFPGEANDGVGAPWLDAGQSDYQSPQAASDDDLAYILYTSGSTGMPKGVMHNHSSALSFVDWAAQTIGPVSEDRFSSHAPFHFDLSILDLYVPLTAGAAIVLVGEEQGKEPQGLAQYIADQAITVWYSVPSILALLAQYGRLDEFDYSALRTVLFAGEVFPVKHLRDLNAHWPGRTYMNLYGPTETNVCTYYQLPDELEPDRETPYPIGRACSNVRALVLDENDQPVSGKNEGVLYIHHSGPVMEGYWGNEQRTRESFHVDADGERWYSTGDVVFTDDEGDFIFVGRRDRMVKRRGYRIELGEIEAGLYRHENVKEAAAVAVADEEGTRVIAFLTSKDGQKISMIALKQFCMRHLPAYMVPDMFRFMEHLPRTSTDKVDYQGLLRTI
jgi:amino acid adenylation domain-containing protein